MFDRLRTLFDRHGHAARRAGIALLGLALGLIAVGGAIRVLRAADRATPTLAPAGRPKPTWTARLDGPVTGLAVDDGRLFVGADELTIFPESCAVDDHGCPPRGRGAVPDGPVSVPTVLDDRVFVGSSEGLLYAFPAACEGDGCSAEWVGVAGSGRVSQPAANFDLVYVASDDLYAFPVACATENATCPPAWTARVPGRPADGPPALAQGLVVVASASTRGGLSAFPAVCGEGCAPVWTGRTDGPATSVAIGDGLAFTVARGRLLAFDLSCSGRCDPAWRAPFARGASFATGGASAPAVAGDRVLVGDDRGRVWVFNSTCDDARCRPIDRFDVTTTPLYTPAIDGERAIVASAGGAVAQVLLECAPGEACERVRIRSLDAPALAPAVIGSEATIAGTDDGSVEAFTW